jgi:putative membrane protein
MLEMLANANWERPIYMAITVGSENHLGMGNHFTQEGLAYRFTPFDTDKLDSKIDSEKMYENLMNKFKFGGIDKPGIYIDENVMRMCYTHRRIFTQLVGQLIKEGKKDKALAALDYAEKMIPAINVPYDWANGAFQMAESYYQLGQNEKANKIIDELANKSLEYMIWYLSLNDNQLAIASENFVYNASLLDAEVRLMEKYKSEELAKHYSTQLDQLYNEYVTRMKGK